MRPEPDTPCFRLSDVAAEEVLLVNGRYALDRPSVLDVEGRQVVFAEGSACLDNSCCGGLDLRYLIVVGEQAGLAGEGWLKPIADDNFARRVRSALARFTDIETVNFYVAPAGSGDP